MPISSKKVKHVVAGEVLLPCIIGTSVAFSYWLHEPECLCISILQNSDILLRTSLRPYLRLWRAEREQNSRADSGCILLFHSLTKYIIGTKHTFKHNFTSCDFQVRSCWCCWCDMVCNVIHKYTWIYRQVKEFVLLCKSKKVTTQVLYIQVYSNL